METRIDRDILVQAVRRVLGQKLADLKEPTRTKDLDYDRVTLKQQSASPEA